MENTNPFSPNTASFNDFEVMRDLQWHWFIQLFDQS